MVAAVLYMVAYGMNGAYGLNGAYDLNLNVFLNVDPNVAEATN